ncbi:uncharacterized protein LOC125097381 [Lutra lutra]|uniref:uncharacterized protein LOC125097381 n=1 Tax=Lutra lutra TaxID=9657 RepID=UPI001FD476DA|nr:uncharacterized protein LOC125097381 [Lutra lutra]
MQIVGVGAAGQARGRPGARGTRRLRAASGRAGLRAAECLRPCARPCAAAELWPRRSWLGVAARRSRPGAREAAAATRAILARLAAARAHTHTQPRGSAGWAPAPGGRAEGGPGGGGGRGRAAAQRWAPALTASGDRKPFAAAGYPRASCHLFGEGPHLCLFSLWRRGELEKNSIFCSQSSSLIPHLRIDQKVLLSPADCTGHIHPRTQLGLTRKGRERREMRNEHHPPRFHHMSIPRVAEDPSVKVNSLSFMTSPPKPFQL